jgi:hypothetical protein
MFQGRLTPSGLSDTKMDIRFDASPHIGGSQWGPGGGGGGEGGRGAYLHLLVFGSFVQSGVEPFTQLVICVRVGSG